MYPPSCFSNILEICAVSPPRFEHLTRFPKLKCAVSPFHLIIKHLMTLVVILAQLVSPSVALLAELVFQPRRPFKIKSVVKYCRLCGIAGGERVPPAPLGWYFDYSLISLMTIFYMTKEDLYCSSHFLTLLFCCFIMIVSL